MANVTVWTSKGRERYQRPPQRSSGLDMGYAYQHGLVGYWPFFGKYGGRDIHPATQNDIVSYVNSAGIRSTPEGRGQGFYASSSTTSRGTCSVEPLHRPNTGYATILFDVYDLVGGTGRRFYAAHGPGSSNTTDTWWLENLSGYCRFGFWVSSGHRFASGHVNTTAKIWQQFASTYDGTTVRLYKDGVEVGTPASYSGTIQAGSGTGTISFGNVGGHPLSFNGYLQNFRIYDRALSATEIARAFDYSTRWELLQIPKRTYFLPGPNSGLTGPNSPAVWTSKTRSKWASPRQVPNALRLPRGCVEQYVFGDNNAHKQLAGVALSKTGTTTLTKTPAGTGAKLAGSSGYFSGTGHERVEFAHEVLFTPTHPTNASAIWTIAEYPNASAWDRSIYVDNTGTITGYIYDGTPKSVRSTSTVRAGEPMHIIITGSDSNAELKIYVNGALEGTTALTGSPYTGYATPEHVFGYGAGDGSGLRGSAKNLTSSSVLHLARVYDTPDIAELAHELAADPWRYHQQYPRTYFIPSGKSASPVVTWRG